MVVMATTTTESDVARGAVAPKFVTLPSPPQAEKTPHGGSFPLGATVCDNGVNFSVFSRHATAIEILLFDDVDDVKPARTIAIDPCAGRTYHYWHAFVPDLNPSQLYAYRAAGPFEPQRGLRFDASKSLLDPYGRGVAVPAKYDRETLKRYGESALAMKSVVVDPSRYDWEGDAPLRHPAARTI